MKKFQENNEGFICEGCGKVCRGRLGLSSHVSKYHKISMKDYINKWIKEKTDLCPICGNPPKYNGYNYNKCCSRNCSKIYAAKKSKEGCFEKYGVENISYLKDTKEKIGRSNKNKSTKALQIRKNTNIKLFGVENPMQNKEIFEKQKISSFKVKIFKKLKYQDSYELDFLNRYYILYPDLINPSPIKYKFKNKIHYYFPDFFIPSLNLVIEIKSLYLFQRDELIIKEKEKATISNGFNYFIIVDKNYQSFDNYLHKASAVCVEQ